MNKAFCTECEKDVDYIIRVKHNVPRLIAGKMYVMKNFYICTCKDCGNLVTVKDYDYKNQEELKRQMEANK